MAETEAISEVSVEHTNNLRHYTPEQAEHRYLLRKVKQQYNIIKDICNRHDHCHDCDYMLSILSNPVKYPDLQSCTFANYNNDQLKQLLDIHE